MGTHSILFDLYGTLLDVQTEQDTPEFWSDLSDHIRQGGGEISAADLRALYFSIFIDERSHLADGFLMRSVLRRLLIATLGEADEEDVVRFGAVFRALSVKALNLKPYATELLAMVKNSSCKVAIVSNTEAILTNYDLNAVPGLRDVDAIVLSSEVGFKKPDARIFDIALRKIGGTRECAIFVGDSFDEDVLGAQRFGLRTLYVSEGTHEVEILSETPKTVKAPPALSSMLEGLQLLGWDKASAQSNETCRHRP